jgi:riboflavin kinase/FMN adenylyltransferase
MNLGRRPTLTEDSGPVPEVHVLDFDGDLVGRRLLFEIRARIRPERKFSSLEALRAQIIEDIAAARRILAAGAGLSLPG